MKKIALKLYYDPDVKQFACYVPVGFSCALLEWLLFYLLSYTAHVHYLPAAMGAFVMATAANGFLGRATVFRAKRSSFLSEMAKIYLTAVLGLVFTLLLMQLFVRYAALSMMLAKVLSTVIVFFWNFFMRRFWIYRTRQVGAE